MSLLDRLAAAFRPEPARKEKASLTASAFYGPDAPTSSYSVNGAKFTGALGGYPSAFDLDYEALRGRSRMAHWESTQARALLGRINDNVIGTGLSPQSSPVWELINSDDDKDPAVIDVRHKWRRLTDTRFMMWANSHECDARGRLTLWEKQTVELLTRMLDGETFYVLRYDDNPRRMSPLKIQSYCADQVIQPTDVSAISAAKARGNAVKQGIELTEDGEEVAIFVCEDPILSPAKTVRIPFFGESGRRFIIHSMNVDNEQQTRGTPLLAHSVHEFRKITDMETSELEAAIINGLFAVQSITDANSSQGPNIAAGLQKKQSTSTASGHASVNMPGIVVTNAPGTKLESFNSGRPNLDVHAFIRNVMKGITSSEGVPISVAEMEHNASYSASRAALLQFWTKVEIWRDSTVSQVLNLIREAWLSEEVAAKRIKAPGFYGKAPIVRAAWLNCGWLGSQMPSLDAEKDARAADLRINQGALTREKNAMQFNNSDYSDNVARLKLENKALADANAPLAAPASPQMALPFDDEEEDTDKNTEDKKPDEGKNTEGEN